MNRVLEYEGEEEEEHARYIENEEEESEGIIADIISVPSRSYGFFTAFVGGQLFPSCPPRAEKPRGYDGGKGEDYPDKGEESDIAEEDSVHLN